MPTTRRETRSRATGALVERERFAASLGLVGRLALGLHERLDSLHEEVGDGPWRFPDVDAGDLSITRLPGDRGDQCLRRIGEESQAFVPSLPLWAWQNDRFNEHSRILGLRDQGPFTMTLAKGVGSRRQF